MEPTTNIRPMPTKKDTHAVVGKRLAEQLMSYSAHGLGDDVDEVASEIAKALDRTRGDYDGFEIGKRLDNDSCWEVDAIMVEELDCADQMVEQELKKMITAWIEETGYEIPFAVGDAVTARWGRSDIQGIVYEIRMDGTALINREEEDGCPVVQWKDIVKISAG